VNFHIKALAGTLGVSVVLGAGALAFQAAPALANEAPTSPCAPVGLIVARASTEAPGNGAIGALAKEIEKDVKAGVSDQSVEYPAQLFPYEPSVIKGDEATKKLLEEEVTRCPSQKIVLLGYSQGAGGGVSGIGPATPPVSSSVGSHVVAMIQYGDPRRIPKQSFDVGTDPGAEGLFPRQKNQLLTAYAPLIQSYCDTGDPFCAKGNNLSAHLDYVEKYDKTANSFVAGKLKAAGIS